MLQVKIDNKFVKIELDMAAAVSAMSYANFRKISNKKILSTNLIFTTYKGEIMTPLGYVNVEAEY